MTELSHKIHSVQGEMWKQERGEVFRCIPFSHEGFVLSPLPKLQMTVMIAERRASAAVIFGEYLSQKWCLGSKTHLCI